MCYFFWMYGVFHAQVHIHYILENFSTLPPCLLTVSYYTCTSAWNFPLSITILLTLVKNFFCDWKVNYNTVSVVYNGRMRQFVILDGKGITTWKRDPGLNGESRSKFVNYISFRIWSTMLSYMYQIHLQSLLAYFVKNVNSSSNCKLPIV